MNGVIKKVRPLARYVLEAEFDGGELRRYDCQRLIDEIPAFQAMVDNPEIFSHPKIAGGGYGVVWNDELDVASEEIWDNGTSCDPSE